MKSFKYRKNLNAELNVKHSLWHLYTYINHELLTKTIETLKGSINNVGFLVINYIHYIGWLQKNLGMNEN